MLTLEALQALDAIDRRGSFAGAAAELHRVPSALSYTIRQLEQSLGVPLFDRSGQRAVMTDTGRMVLSQGRELLAAAELLSHRARQAASGWEPRLRLVVEAILPMAPLWPLVAEFAAAHPYIEVELREEALNGSWEALLDGRADLLIGVNRGELPGQRVSSSLLGQLTMPLMCAADHPLAGLAPDAITDELLSQHTQVVLRDSARRLAPLSVGLYRVRRRILVDHYAAKEQAIRAGLGFGTLPETRVAQALVDGQLVRLPVAGSKLVDLSCVWLADRAGQGVAWFEQAIRARGIFSALLSPAAP